MKSRRLMGSPKAEDQGPSYSRFRELVACAQQKRTGHFQVGIKASGLAPGQLPAREVRSTPSSGPTRAQSAGLFRAKALNRFAIVAAVGRPERCPQGRVRWRAIAGACLMDLSLNLLEHGAVRMIGHRTIRNFTPKILGLLCQ
jgi:hypothetical protein